MTCRCSPSAIIGTLYGLSDELHQSFVPGRDASIEDAAADAFGALLGSLALVLYFARRLRYARK